MLIEDQVFQNAFALHDGSVHDKKHPGNLRTFLYISWSGWFKHQPIHDIRSYFGERIAFHFAWLGHYTHWLMMSGTIGVVVFVYGIGSAFLKRRGRCAFLFRTFFNLRIEKS